MFSGSTRIRAYRWLLAGPLALSRARSCRESELVADIAQQAPPVGHVGSRLDADGRRAVDDADDPAAAIGDGDKTSTGFAVAQKTVQTSGTDLSGFSTLTGNPSRSTITKTCPALMANAFAVARP